MSNTAVLERPVCVVTNLGEAKVPVVVSPNMTVRDALGQGGISSPGNGQAVVADGTSLVDLDDKLGNTQALEVIELFANG